MTPHVIVEGDDNQRFATPKDRFDPKLQHKIQYEAGQRVVRRVGMTAVTAASLALAASILYAVMH